MILPFGDSLYWLLTLPPLALSLWAQWRVKATFKKYSKVGVSSGMTGAAAAAAVLRSSGLEGLRIEQHQGFLSDHYDPRSRTLRLSPDVYEGRSVSAVAVAAHEAGHALQHAADYGPLALRSNLVPVVQIGSQLWMVPFFAGMLVPSLGGLMWIGIALFAAVVLFQLVTLPTEFDASKRARAVLASTGVVNSDQEQEQVGKVLNAAAMTYVAALIAGLMQLVWMILRAQRN